MADFKQRFVRLTSRYDGAWLVHPSLRQKLVEDADEQGTNLTDIVVQIFARHYHVTIAPAGRRTAPAVAGEELNLRIPSPLDRAIGLAAAANERSRQQEMRATLCAHYGLRLPAPPKRTRRRRPAVPTV